MEGERSFSRERCATPSYSWVGQQHDVSGRDERGDGSDDGQGLSVVGGVSCLCGGLEALPGGTGSERGTRRWLMGKVSWPRG